MYKVLVVDDMRSWQIINGNLLSEILGDDTEIITADSAKHGMKHVISQKNKPFDLIITDLQMENDFEPDYAGEWLVKTIKVFKEYYKTCIILVSASANIKTVADNLNISFIPKSTILYNSQTLRYMLEENGFKTVSK